MLADDDEKHGPDLELVGWLRSHIVLPGYQQSMWNDDHHELAASFLTNKGACRLLAYIDKENGLVLQEGGSVPKRVRRVQYFSRSEDGALPTRDTVADLVQFGVISVPPLDSLLSLMNGVFLPTFLANQSWPESTRREFTGQLHKFMASLTETVHQLRKHTVLYLPDEKQLQQPNYIEVAKKDKDLVQRLETTLIHWTRQIKEVVSNQETTQQAAAAGGGSGGGAGESSTSGPPGPLDEIAYWQSRTLDLSGIRSQLDRPGVKQIVAVLTAAGSTYLQQFNNLSQTIQLGSTEANNNLAFLSTLHEPCTRLAKANTKDIPAILPEILRLIRMIWTISKFYNTPDRITGLLRKVSNQIIKQCSARISLADIFEGDVEASMAQLRQSILCANAWHEAYARTVAAIARDTKCPRKWDFDLAKSGIFSQIDAFVQRCHNLLEVCEGQLQFARKRSGLPRGAKAELPHFPGSRGADTQKSLQEIEERFQKHIDKLANLEYGILDVKATAWHYDYNSFKTGLNEAEKMMGNVIQSAWEGVATVRDAVELLEAFDSLAKRQGMARDVRNKAQELYSRLFREGLKSVKTAFENVLNGREATPPLSANQPRHAGTALWARSLRERMARDYTVLRDAAGYLTADNADDCFKFFMSAKAQMDAHTAKEHKDWETKVEAAIKEKSLDDRLERPVIIRTLDPKSDGKLSDKEKDEIRRLAKEQVDAANRANSLLTRKSSGRLESNFDKDLLRLFNEVRYWEKFNGEFDVPYQAHLMYREQDGLRVLRESIMLVVRDYNAIVDALPAPNDRRLFTEHLARVDHIIKPGLYKLSWSEKNAIRDWFVRVCRTKCREVFDIVQLYKRNNDRIASACDRMANTLLVEIDKAQVYGVDQFESTQRIHHEKARADLEAAHNEIIKVTKETYGYFAEDVAKFPDTIGKEWSAYVEHIDARVEHALRSTVVRSLQELARSLSTDSKTGHGHPFLTLNMVFDEDTKTADYKPPHSLLNRSISDIIQHSVATVQTVPRLAELLEQTVKHQQLLVQQAQLKAAEAEKEARDRDAEAQRALAAAQSKYDPNNTSMDDYERRKTARAAEAKAAADLKASQIAAAAAAAALAVPAPKQKPFFTLIYSDPQVSALKHECLNAVSEVKTKLDAALRDRTVTQIPELIASIPHLQSSVSKYEGRAAVRPEDSKTLAKTINDYRQSQKSLHGVVSFLPIKFLRVDCHKVKEALLTHCQTWQNKLCNMLHDQSKKELAALHDDFYHNTAKILREPDRIDQYNEQRVLLAEFKKLSSKIMGEKFFPLEESYNYLIKEFEVPVAEEEKELLEKLKPELSAFQQALVQAEETLEKKKDEFQRQTELEQSKYIELISSTLNDFKDTGPFFAPLPGQGEPDLDGADKSIRLFEAKFEDNQKTADELRKAMLIFFKRELPDYKEALDLKNDLALAKDLWGAYREWLALWAETRVTPFRFVNVGELDTRARGLKSQVEVYGRRGARHWKVYESLMAHMHRFLITMPLIDKLQDKAMRARHWKQLSADMQLPHRLRPNADTLTLDSMFALELHGHAEVITQLYNSARRELITESTLNEIVRVWREQKLDLVEYKKTYRHGTETMDVVYHKIKSVDAVNELLDQHQSALNNMKNSDHFATFEAAITRWLRRINELAETLDKMVQVQRLWTYLEQIFMDNQEIRKHLERDGHTRNFDAVNAQWREIMARMHRRKRAQDLLHPFNPRFLALDPLLPEDRALIVKEFGAGALTAAAAATPAASASAAAAAPKAASKDAKTDSKHSAKASVSSAPAGAAAAAAAAVPAAAANPDDSASDEDDTRPATGGDAVAGAKDAEDEELEAKASWPLLDRLQAINTALERINHGLNNYLDTKRKEFPRFYFLSNDNLLEILGQRDPGGVQKHVKKMFMAVNQLDISASLAKAKAGASLLLASSATLGGYAHLFDVKGMLSAEGELVPFLAPVTVDGEVEHWLTAVEQSMRNVLRRKLHDCHASITVKEKGAKTYTRHQSAMETFVKTHIGQVVIAAAQTAFCERVNDAVEKGGAAAPRKLMAMRAEWKTYLRTISSVILKTDPPLTPIERLKLEALLTIEVHHKEILNRLASVASRLSGGSSSVSGAAAADRALANSFEWTSQLRYTLHEHKDPAEARFLMCYQAAGSFGYGYEYQGNSPRLVITPTTDRCYITLTTALKMKYGGSPQGPAGTGKTETVKELGRSLGRMVVVYNCSPSMSVETLARAFSGLAQTGAWGCFDEFNRILIEVLSVVTLQVSSILQALAAEEKEFLLERGKRIRLHPYVGIFATFNPGYAGRTELPDNLKSMFRPVAMMAADIPRIADVMLRSLGFKDGKVAERLVNMFRLLPQQLSVQDHYAYDLRSIKAVMYRAGVLRRDPLHAKTSEDMIMVQALKDMNAPRLTADDLVLFESCLTDVFSTNTDPPTEFKELRAEIGSQLARENLQITELLINKIIQLYVSKGIRLGNMLVGPTCTGKSTCWRILAQALTSLAARDSGGRDAKDGGKGRRYDPVIIDVLNPKAYEVDELYGNHDRKTKEWAPGIMATILKHFCEDTKAPHTTEKWMVLDGPVDTEWVESLNSVLDDSKVLTLLNADRIPFPKEVSILFEVADLAAASPATVSRCGMVFLDRGTITWRNYVYTWLAAKAAESELKIDEREAAQKHLPIPIWTKEGVEALGKLFDGYAAPVLAFKANDYETTEPIPISEFNAIQSLCRLFDAVATFENGIDPKDDANYLRMIEMWFAFSIVWSIGGALSDAGRVRLDAFIKDQMVGDIVHAPFPGSPSCYDHFVDPHKRDWIAWDDKVNSAWRRPVGVPFHKILVPTNDTIRYNFLLNALVRRRVNTLVVGDTGVGKTAIVEALQDALAQEYLSFTMNFSNNTTARTAQELLESRLMKRNKNVWGPTGGKARMLTFIDDLNMPRKDEYGTQSSSELLKQYIDYGFLHNRRDKTSPHEKKIIQDMQLLCAMGWTGGARSELSKRLLSRFNVLHFTFPSDATIKRVYQALLMDHFSEFDAPVKVLAGPLTNATVELYKQVIEDYKAAPATPHYAFNMRDISKVFQGVLQSETKYYDTKDTMIRLWVHEVLRVFYDRLVSDDHRNQFVATVNGKLVSMLETNWKNVFSRGTGPATAGTGVGAGYMSSSAAAAAAAAAAGSSQGGGGDNRLPLFGNFMEDVTTSSVSDEKAVPTHTSTGAVRKAPYVELTHKFRDVKAYLERTLAEYNREPDVALTHPLPLVLFEQAVIHVSRLYRIVSQPRGSALLIGMGGVGRQSLTRLAAYMCGHKVKQIETHRNYGRREFYDDLKLLYRATGEHEQSTVFLFSDTQLRGSDIPTAGGAPNPKDPDFEPSDRAGSGGSGSSSGPSGSGSFLEDINCILTSGDIPKLFTNDEINEIVGGEKLRADALKQNRSITSDAMYQFFIERVRAHLHVVICMSPVGDAFFHRIRMYPALVNCCTIDYFDKWPQSALREVAIHFLAHTDVATGVSPGAAAALGASGHMASHGVAHGGHHGHGHKIKDALADMFCSSHLAALDTAQQMSAQVSRPYYVTAAKFLDLVKTYNQTLRDKRVFIGRRSEKLKQSMATLDSAKEKVIELDKKRQEMEKQLQVAKEQVFKMNDEITQRQQNADNTKRKVETDRARLESEEKDGKANQEAARQELSKVEPQLKKAAEVLEGLDSKAISEVRNYQNPGKAVVKVMECIMILLEQGDVSWNNAKKLMADPNFLTRLRTFDQNGVTEATLKKLARITKQREFNREAVEKQSRAASYLFDWVCAMELYAKVYRDWKPKRDRAEEATKHLHGKQEELKKSEAAFTEIHNAIGLLKKEKDEAERKKEEINKKALLLQGQLTRATKLMDGFTHERDVWVKQLDAFTVDLSNLVGDVALVATFLTYIGPFPSTYRDTLRADWLATVRRLNLPVSNHFDVVRYLVEPSDVMDWTISKLPSDTFSVENGVLVTRARRWPLLIDPQGQAKFWIQANEKRLGHHLITLDFTHDAYLSTLEKAVASGHPVLLQDVAEELDSALDPILNVARDEEPGAARAINLPDGRTLKYNRNFMLFISTKLANPHFKPEVCIKTCVVNFAVKEKGLQDQLLSRVIMLENEALEDEKKKAVLAMAGAKRQLLALEDDIVNLLRDAGPDLLDNEKLINKLTESKKSNTDVKELLDKKEIDEKLIDSKREEYRPVAVRAAVLYFVLHDLSHVDPMYQFSLASYLDLFERSIIVSRADDKSGGGGGGGADQDETVAERILNLNAYHTEAVFRYASRALYERHKLLLAFQMCAQQLRYEGKINAAEFDFFLRGGPPTMESEHTREPNPCDWLAPEKWTMITELSKLRGFSDLTHSFVHSPGEWRNWMRNEDTPPERNPPPGEYQNKRNAFQNMLILRCLRPDRVVYAVRNFIKDKMGPGASAGVGAGAGLGAGVGSGGSGGSAGTGSVFTDPPPFDLAATYAESKNKPLTPFIFLLSPGADPTGDLRDLARKENRALEIVALGEGQAETVPKLLEAAVTNGSWLFLSNCHLSLAFLPELERLVDALPFRSLPVHASFRLWLSSDPTPKFPISLLQNAIKMTLEPPRGLKSNMLHLYRNVITNPNDDLWSLASGAGGAGAGAAGANATTGGVGASAGAAAAAGAAGAAGALGGMPAAGGRSRPAQEAIYRKLLFSLSFFHSVLIERKKFANLGWNVRYEFNESDFRVCAKMIAHLLDTNDLDAIPWDAMRYLVATANYGGRVTDQRDLRLLGAYAAQYFCPDVLGTSVGGVGGAGGAGSAGAVGSRYSLTPLNEVYFVPDDSRDVEAYRKLISAWPKVELEQAEVFGQHPNADVASQTAATKVLLSTMLSLQPRVTPATSSGSGGGLGSGSSGSGSGGSGGAGGGSGNEKSREDLVLDTLAAIKALVPPEMDLKAVRKIQESKAEKTPLTIVLYQEIDRYNQLLRVIHSSITDLQRATRGDILRSPELDAMFDAVFRNAVPARWQTAYPSTKPLGPWTRDLANRILQLHKWGNDNQPKVFWLSGFIHPMSFLTALLQTSSRRNKQAFEALTWEFVVITVAEQSLNAQPKDGAYIKGLWLEGGRWDVDAGTLAEPNPMELYCPMPIVHFKPVERDKKKGSKGVYQCPLYTYPVRAGSVDRPSYLMDVDLKTGPRGDWQFWSKRGTALLLTRDDL